MISAMHCQCIVSECVEGEVAAEGGGGGSFRAAFGFHAEPRERKKQAAVWGKAKMWGNIDGEGSATRSQFRVSRLF